MKTLMALFVFVIALIFLNVGNSFAAKGIDGKLLGVWRLTEIIDSKTGDSSYQKALVMYHFHGDGTVLSTNRHTRERLKWKWVANRKVLKMKSTTTQHYLAGNYRYVDEDTIRYYVKIAGKRFIWVFERY